jgi:hypothetical protein
MLSSTPDLFNFFGDDTHAFLYTFLIPDSNFTNGPDTFFNKLGINLIHILFKFLQDKLIVFIVNNSGEDFDFFVLNVVRVSEFGEEALDVVLKDGWTLLNDVLNVFKDYVLHLFRSE